MFAFYEWFTAKTYIFLTFKIFQGIQFCSEKRREFQPHLSNLKQIELKSWNLTRNRARHVSCFWEMFKSEVEQAYVVC